MSKPPPRDPAPGGRDWARLVLRYAAARRWNGEVAQSTYLLGGPHETRITVVSQQERAINLAVALHLTKAFAPDRRVAVVGAGAGGATFAAAASLLAAKVDLFDEHEEPISTQRWSFDRYLHPNLFDWPVRNWASADAGLPILDWSAGPSAETRLKILAGFARATAHGGVRWFPQHSVSEVREHAENQVELTVCDLRTAGSQPPAGLVELVTPRYDLVVVATGFLPEDINDDADASGSYWKDQGLPSAPAEHVTIVGDGDGALTELLLLTVCRAPGGQAAHEQLHSIASAIAAEHGHEIEQVLKTESDLAASRGHGSLEHYARDGDTSGWRPALNGRHPSIEIRAGRVALKNTSFAINRFLAARLARDGQRIRIVQGSHHTAADAKHFRPAHVIWRTGPRPRERTMLARPSLSVRAAGDAMARDPQFLDVVGVVDQVMDFSRGRHWSDEIRRDEQPAGRPAPEVLVTLENAVPLQGGFAAPWPAFVEPGAERDIVPVVERLAELADQLGDGWANLKCHRAWFDGKSQWVADLSLDVVAAAVDLTPTEVVHALRSCDLERVQLVTYSGIRTGVPSRPRVRRLWVRCRLRPEPLPREAFIPAEDLSADFTLLSLLLAPSFRAQDVVDEEGTVRFRTAETLAGPEDTVFRWLFLAVLRTRARQEHTEPVELTAELIGAIKDGHPAAARLVMLDVWQKLRSVNDLDVRRALLRLAAVLLRLDSVPDTITDYLPELSELPAGRPLAELFVAAAFGHLAHAPSGTALEHDPGHLRWYLRRLGVPDVTPAAATAELRSQLRLTGFGLEWRPG